MRLNTQALFVALVIALAPLAVAQAQEFSSLEERMSGAEYRQSGLDKLSDEELAALNEWIRRNLGTAAATAVPARAAAPAAVDRQGFMTDGAALGPIVTRISGEFRGWDGSNTVFRLDNGQVWQSTDPAARLAVRLQDPEVTIRPGMAGAWFLSVEGYNSRVRVRRVE